MRVHAHSTTGKGSVGRLARRTSRHLALLTLYANSLFAMGHEAEAERLLTPLSQLDGFADLAQQVRGACTDAGSRVRVRCDGDRARVHCPQAGTSGCPSAQRTTSRRAL